jgi:hypothetical protein
MELRYPFKIVIVYYFLVLTDHDFISIFFLLKNIELRKNYEYKFFRTQTCSSKGVSGLTQLDPVTIGIAVCQVSVVLDVTNIRPNHDCHAPYAIGFVLSKSKHEWA